MADFFSVFLAPWTCRRFIKKMQGILDYGIARGRDLREAWRPGVAERGGACAVRQEGPGPPMACIMHIGVEVRTGSKYGGVWSGRDLRQGYKWSGVAGRQGTIMGQ